MLIWQVWGEPPEKRFLISLRPIKGHDVLIEAVRKLRARHPDIATHVLIVGDGVLRAAYEKASEALPISFAGFRPDVEWLYRAADVYCQPSRSEGLPNAVIEAMCSGLPVVASDVGGMRELVSHANGVLVRPVDSEDLANGVASLLSKPECLSDMGKASLSLSERFAVERMVAQYVAAYREATGVV